MAKSKYVKLGEKASVFFDPTTKLKITPGKAVELSNDNRQSKRVLAALRSGHLEYANEGNEEDENLEFVSLSDLKANEEGKKNAARSKGAEKSAAGKQKAAENKARAQENEEEEEEEGEDEWDEKSLKRLKKPELVQMAKDNGSEMTEEELEDATKEELATEILSLLEEE